MKYLDRALQERPAIETSPLLVDLFKNCEELPHLGGLSARRHFAEKRLARLRREIFQEVQAPQECKSNSRVGMKPGLSCQIAGQRIRHHQAGNADSYRDHRVAMISRPESSQPELVSVARAAEGRGACLRPG